MLTPSSALFLFVLAFLVFLGFLRAGVNSMNNLTRHRVKRLAGETDAEYATRLNLRRERLAAQANPDKRKRNDLGTPEQTS